jgi:hypothetical protein
MTRITEAGSRPLRGAGNRRIGIEMMTIGGRALETIVREDDIETRTHGLEIQRDPIGDDRPVGATIENGRPLAMTTEVDHRAGTTIGGGLRQDMTTKGARGGIEGGVTLTDVSTFFTK